MILHSSTPMTSRLEAKWSAYAANRRGAAAVEFALIAVPFFFLIFGLLEICLIFIMSTVLEHAVMEAARPLRTGQAQSAGVTQNDFRKSICSELLGLMDCTTKLHIDVRTMNNFGSGTPATPIDGNGNFDNSGFIFNPGNANDIVVVRAFYEWDLVIPGLSQPLRNMAGNKHLLRSTAIFRNEPFGS